jgi:sulfur transfer complex TusBCD TusB component (DsrH family)
MKILNIVESAYRGTLEEQDDTILWLSRSVRSAGADLTVLLRGNAVNYLVEQDCPRLSIGDGGVSHPARPRKDLRALQDKGTQICALAEDVDRRGIARDECLPSVRFVSGDDVATLFENHQQVWHW